MTLNFCISNIFSLSKKSNPNQNIIDFTFQCRTDSFPDGKTSALVELPQSQLHVEQGHPPEDQHYAVRNQEGTCNKKQSSHLFRASLKSATLKVYIPLLVCLILNWKVEGLPPRFLRLRI